MKLKFILTGLFVLSSNFAAQAQTPTPTPQTEQTKQEVKTEQTYTAQDYENLLANAFGFICSVFALSLQFLFFHFQ